MSNEMMGELRNSIAWCLKGQHTGKDLPTICDKFGIISFSNDSSDISKRQYVLNRLRATPENQIPDIATNVGDAYGELDLSEAGLFLLEESVPPISEITRKDAARCFEDVGLSGVLDLLDFLGRIWPIERMAGESLFKQLPDEIHQHMVRNDDWSVEDLFERLGAYKSSLRRFLAMLELALNPVCRRGSDQEKLRDRLSNVLARDGYEISFTDTVSDYPVYTITPIGGVHASPKNLIFASNGPKPDIGFSDAVSNDIVILSNADSCLVYDRPITGAGLLWVDLVEWWAENSPADAPEDVFRKELGHRLQTSLASKGEENLFNTFFKEFHEKLGKSLPALVPQVYLHYDPATIRELKGKKRIPRQRMDFLMLLPRRARVVLEVDGKHHFADEEGRASHDRYAEMVSADRDLRLKGYEVYRFSAKELVGESAMELIVRFFERLLARHHVIR